MRTEFYQFRHIKQLEADKGYSSGGKVDYPEIPTRISDQDLPQIIKELGLTVIGEEGSKNWKIRARRAIDEKRREQGSLSVATAAPLVESVPARIESPALRAYEATWGHLRHAAPDASPNGVVSYPELPFKLPAYPLRKIDVISQKVDKVVKEAVGETPIEPDQADERIDAVFTGLEWQRQIRFEGRQDETNGLDDLLFLGVDPKQVATTWGDLTGSRIISLYFIERREQPEVDHIASVVQTRKAMAETVMFPLDRKLSNFFRHNPDVTHQAVIAFFKERPRKEAYQEEEIEIEQQALQQRLEEVAEATLAERVGVAPDAVPLSYGFLTEWQEAGVITPQFPVLEQLNQNIVKGEQIDLYCCPNYARHEREDGVMVYTFDGLTPGLGLTAERSFPFLMNVIDRRGTQQTTPPVNVRIGIADFEATPQNAQLVGLTVEGFKTVLGHSVEKMIEEVVKACDDPKREYDYTVARVNDESEPIGEWQVTIRKDGTQIAHLSFGAVTKTYEGRVEGYTQETFEQLVERQRGELGRRAKEDKAFQQTLDAGLSSRLGIMLDWPNGEETQEVKALAEIYNQLTDTNFATVLDSSGIFHGLAEQINPILADRDKTEQEKDMITRDIILAWLKKEAEQEARNGYGGDKPATVALQGIRERTAQQLAEYSVMSFLMKRAKTGVHLTADATVMWEMAGQTAVPRINIKGGYEGA